MAEKTLFEKYIKPLGIGFLVSAIGALVVWYITDQNRNHDVDQRIFPTVSDLNETLTNNGAKPSEKEVYIMAQEALEIKKEAVEYQKQTVEQGDSLLELAEYFKENTQKIDSFFILKEKYDIRDSILEKKKEESRSGRDATNRKILEKNNEIFKILKEIKNDTTN